MSFHMVTDKPAPKFLNLLQIRLPPGGVTSIAHRVSGVFLFFTIPFAAWLFDLSLRDTGGYRQVLDWLHTPLLRLVAALLVWSLAHHLLAGLRHLLLDVGIGVERLPARRSAQLVNFAALGFAALYLAALA